MRGTILDAIHRLLAYGAVATTAVAIAWSLVLVATGRATGAAFERLQAAVVSVLLVGSVSGVLLLLAGPGPADGLHLLYAAVAIAVIPLARSFLTPERRAKMEGALSERGREPPDWSRTTFEFEAP